jgi:hypothetical protein
MSFYGLLACFGAASLDCTHHTPERPPISSDNGREIPGSVAGGGGSSGVQGGAVVDGGDASTACNNLVNTGNVVDQTAVADTLPNGLGGTIIDGKYALTDTKVYVGVTGQPGLNNVTYRGTIAIVGQSFERVLDVKSAGGTTSEQRVTGNLVPSGVNATLTFSCPAGSEQFTYGVGTNTLTLGDLATKETFTFTLQP